MAAAARVTERILLATLLSNPVNRHPTVTASSIATVDELAPGRTLLGWGVGDTAVRLAGLKPARVQRARGEHAPDARAARRRTPSTSARASRRACRTTARCRSGSPPAVRARCAWPAASPTACSSASGTHQANIAKSIEEIRAGAVAAGRDPSTVGLGAVFHTVLVEDAGAALTMGKSMAAGYYEYSPMLFEPPRLVLVGAGSREAQARASRLSRLSPRAGSRGERTVVDFLPDAAADAFCLRGGSGGDRGAAARRAPVGAGALRLRLPAPDPEPGGAGRPRARLHGPRRPRGVAARARRPRRLPRQGAQQWLPILLQASR